MKQESAHLSDSQIEQMSSPGSVLEPDTELRMETHLGECPPCRKRLVESQRTRLAISFNAPMSTPAHADCPREDDVRDLAAGICDVSQVGKLTEHIIQCDHCGPLLRRYTEDFADELSSKDNALLKKLKSSSRAGRKKLAGRMLHAAGKIEKRRSSFYWVVAPVGALACAAIAFFLWVAQQKSPQRVETLLAQAYAQNRNLEMRIPYAAHAGFHQLKGGGDSRLNSPESLRKATDTIVAQLKKDPGAPGWLLLGARLDLLDWNYKSALAALNKIDLETPELRATKALALYERAEMEHNRQDYGEAVDLLGKNLQQNPHDPIALFNQAVACEKIYMYECASQNFEHLLAIEKDSGWAAEARERLKRIEEKKTPED